MLKHVTTDLTTGEIKIEDAPGHLAHLPPRQMLEQLVHDCPECRAARERGEQPTFFKPPPRDVIRDRRPRWRKLKRHVRR